MQAEVHPSMLVYLFAHLFANDKTFVTTSVDVPCQDGRGVRADDLAAHMFAVAFWSLREQGVLALEANRRKRLGVIPTTRAEARLVTAVERPGLEGAITSVMKPGGPVAVRSVVRSWFDDDVGSPDMDVVQVEIDAAVSAGLVDRREVDVGRGRVAGALLGRTRVVHEPRCERIGELTAAAITLQSRWRGFQRTEYELHKVLVEQVGRAITSRSEDRGDHADYD